MPRAFRTCALVALAVLQAGCGGGGILTPSVAAARCSRSDTIVVNPASFHLTAGGYAAVATAQDDDPTKPLWQTNTCSALARVAFTPNDDVGADDDLTITPIGAGSCTVTVQDATGCLDVPVVVAAAGASAGTRRTGP